MKRELIRNLLLKSIILICLISSISCKKKDNQPSPDNQNKEESKTTIDGVSFNPESVSAISVAGISGGYDFSFSDASFVVNISTSSKSSGTYTICPNCKLADGGNIASANITKGEETYNATSGTITITVSADGKISGTYSFEAVNQANITIEVKNGAFFNVAHSELSEEEHFKAILKSKIWVITKYEYKDYRSEVQTPAIVDYTKTSIPTESNSVTPDVCSWGELKTTREWIFYQLKFTESAVMGYFLNDEVKPVSSLEDCSVNYVRTNKIKNINDTWSYHADGKKLNTNFGDVYDIVGSEEFFKIDYVVVSYSSSKIVLEGKGYYQNTHYYDNNIILE